MTLNHQPVQLGAEYHATELLAHLGVPHTESTEQTPARFVAAMRELVAGQHLNPRRHLTRTFPAESPDPGMVVVQRVPFVSLCEHHLLPFTGHATIAYLPAPRARIVGLSKLARLVTEYAARPQVQERLGHQVTDAIDTELDTLGSACLLAAQHACLTLRGARATGAWMTTSHTTGEFRTDPATRAEFLQLTRTEGP